MDDSSQKSGKPPGVKPRPQLSKAERRALQEKQKADKAAAAAPSASKATNTPSEKSKKPDQRTTARPTPRQRLSISTAQHKDAASVVSADAENILKELRIFSHFASSNKSTSSSKVEIHPAIVRLALQFSEFQIVGANARCLATITALKEVIRDYSTPPRSSLSRDIISHLSPQINHLVNARPMSTSMSNAIRYLKAEVNALTTIEDDLPERDAKKILHERLDTYVQDKILHADYLIARDAYPKIREQKDDAMILTFAKSSTVEKTLLHAWGEGKQFRVHVVDSGPLFEGKRMLHSLSKRGIKCSYSLVTALGSVMPTIDLVILGAHALHANGALYSRAGTALVAMMAAKRSIPVLACCETYKFSKSVPFDGFTKNELAPSNSGSEPQSFLQTLNPLYDLTPPSAITAVVTELGLVPPSSVPTILYKQGLMNE